MFRKVGFAEFSKMSPFPAPFKSLSKRSVEEDLKGPIWMFSPVSWMLFSLLAFIQTLTGIGSQLYQIKN